jgi:L-fuconolactonase
VILDAHVHFWDPAARHHDWLSGSLDRPFGPADLPAAHDVVFVEADCRVEEAVDEVTWVAGLGDPRVRAIVANAPLEDGPDALEPVLGLPLVRGVRRQIEPRPAEFALAAGFVAAVRRLGELGRPFDACVHRGQLRALAALADAAPRTTIVLDHLGKPDVAGGGLDPWRADLAALAAREHVVCKLSGLATQADAGAWERQVVPYLEHALAVFGPERCLAGSDWPVLTRAASYERWFAILAAVAPEPVLGATAAEVYGL